MNKKRSIIWIVKLMMVSGGITGWGEASAYTDTSEIWTGSEWRFTSGKLPYTARDVRMAFIDNRILYLGIKARKNNPCYNALHFNTH